MIKIRISQAWLCTLCENRLLWHCENVDCENLRNLLSLIDKNEVI